MWQWYSYLHEALNVEGWVLKHIASFLPLAFDCCFVPFHVHFKFSVLKNQHFSCGRALERYNLWNWVSIRISVALKDWFCIAFKIRVFQLACSLYLFVVSVNWNWQHRAALCIFSCDIHSASSSLYHQTSLFLRIIWAWLFHTLIFSVIKNCCTLQSSRYLWTRALQWEANFHVIYIYMYMCVLCKNLDVLKLVKNHHCR